MPSNRSNHGIPLSAPTELEQAALAWFARCNRGLTPEQETEFEEWLAADSRHARLFNEFDGTWELIGEAEKVPAGVGEAALRRDFRATAFAGGSAPAAIPLRRKNVRAIFLSFVLAAAAALIVAYVGWWRPAHYSSEAATTVGAWRTLRLPDGSLVTLNTDSVVSVAFTPKERRVRLDRGETHFTIAKNAARPFIIEAGGISIRAVGTAFNVRLQPKTLEVLVTEGKVVVSNQKSDAGSQAPVVEAAPVSALPSSFNVQGSVFSPLSTDLLLTSGQRVVVALPNAADLVEYSVTTMPADEIQRQLAWQERRLDFVAEPLTAIVEEFNRYNKHRLIIADPALAAKRFGGSFKQDDQAGFVRMLQENFGVVADVSETRTMLRAAR